jgi:PKD repeat protein
MPCTVPSAPQNLTAVAGNGNVTLTWQPPADNGGMPITGYRIYYGTTARNYTVNITVGNVTAYTITNLTSGQKYYFAVSALTAAGEGAKSNEVSATPIAEPNPTPGFDVIAYIYAGVVCIGIIMLGRKKRR